MASYALCASPNVDDSVPIQPRPVTRPMRLKVLYTFDNAQKTTCLARSSSIFQVQVIHCPPASPTSSPTRTPPRNHSSSSSSRRRPDVVGAIDLRSCIAAVASSSPELVADPSIDYAVYTVDFSERDQPLVGHGLLSWALASSAAPQHQDSINSTENQSSISNPTNSSNNPSAPSDLSAIPTRDNSHSSGAAATAHEVAAGTLQMVCGRVCSNVMNMFGNHGVRETLEIKLRLQPVRRALSLQYVFQHSIKIFSLTLIIFCTGPRSYADAVFEIHAAIRPVIKPNARMLRRSPMDKLHPIPATRNGTFDCASIRRACQQCGQQQ
ncbi:hypothetical protein BZA70DRAFT_273530 [Myxozyma melibiosi]|uniref:Ams2/SPT21 N-terminal domain-containing protein n=1 Tax=Myxozyma melibiosi TaxID=54550 RepID=A0ABR1FES1_9ASCO